MVSHHTLQSCSDGLLRASVTWNNCIARHQVRRISRNSAISRGLRSGGDRDARPERGLKSPWAGRGGSTSSPRSDDRSAPRSSSGGDYERRPARDGHDDRRPARRDFGDRPARTGGFDRNDRSPRDDFERRPSRSSFEDRPARTPGFGRREDLGRSSSFEKRPFRDDSDRRPPNRAERRESMFGAARPDRSPAVRPERTNSSTSFDKRPPREDFTRSRQGSFERHTSRDDVSSRPQFSFDRRSPRDDEDTRKQFFREGASSRDDGALKPLRDDRRSSRDDGASRPLRDDRRPPRDDDATKFRRNDAPSSRPPYRSNFNDSSEDTNSTRDPRIPFSIPYTTAASVFISGTRAVSAAMSANRRQLYKLHHAEPSSRPTPERTTLLSRAKTLQVPISPTSMGFLDALTGKLNKKADDLIHDGVILEASALPQKPITFLSTTNTEEGTFSFRLGVQTREEAAITGTATSLPFTSEKWRHPFLLWLHGIVDTRNLGAIARTALYFGVDALVLTQRATASADNAFALRSSAGALEYLPVLTVPPTTTPDDFVTASQNHGWHFVGAVAPPSRATAKATLSHAFLHEMRNNPVEEKPTVLVLGNEDLGLPAALVKKMEGQVSIRGPKAEARRAGLDSLNVGIAGAVLCEWFLARRSVGSLVKERREREDEQKEEREGKVKEAKEKLF